MSVSGKEGVGQGRTAARGHAVVSVRDVRLVLVDDHPVFLSGLADCLEEIVGLTVIGTAATARAGTAMIRDLRPDVAVVDLLLPDASGLDVARSVSALRPPLGVLLLSGVPEPPNAFELLAAGVRSYLCKTVDSAEIGAAVVAVAYGLGLQATARSTSPPLKSSLTAREHEVLILVLQGLRNTDIAIQLGISVHTVEYHNGQLFTKLGVRSRWELIARARQTHAPSRMPGENP